jgi:hypothetical protein
MAGFELGSVRRWGAGRPDLPVPGRLAMSRLDLGGQAGFG